MITDSQTNFVYLSELLLKDSLFQAEARHLTDILSKHGIEFGFLPGTKDIWARDYMPLQLDDNLFVQFVYDPSYLESHQQLKTNPISVASKIGVNPILSGILLDGGNVVKANDKVIVADRIFYENKDYDKVELVSDIKELLGVKVILIKSLPIKCDFTGHSDGYLRFIDDQTVLVNQLDLETRSWRNHFAKTMSDNNLEYYEIPRFDDSAPDSAIGCYVNYLEVGNLIVFPVFNIKGNADDKALTVMQKCFPNHKIEPINVNSIAKEGGLLNCITWNIKR